MSAIHASPVHTRRIHPQPQSPHPGGIERELISLIADLAFVVQSHAGAIDDLARRVKDAERMRKDGTP